MPATRLSAFDSMFLNLDTSISVGHVCSTAILDGPVDMATLRKRLLERHPLMPVLHKRLSGALLPRGRPWLVDDDNLDLDAHLFERHLARPDRQCLIETIVDITRPHLDRRKPLWEVYLTHGLADGHTAVSVKMHHVLVDGIAGRDLLSDLLGSEPPHRPDGARAVPATGGAQAAVWGDPQSLSARAAGTVADVVDVASGALSLEVRAANEAVSWALGMPGDGLPLRAPSTPFNGTISANRAWTFTEVSNAATRPARRQTGATVNDVVIAAAAGGLRSWLLEIGELPEDPLIGLIPMAAERGARPAFETNANSLALTRCALPTHLEDPRERLEVVHEEMLRGKERPWLNDSLVRQISATSSWFLVAPLATLLAKVGAMSATGLPYNVMISSVPSGPTDLTLGGARVLATYPFPPLADGLGLNITAQSFGDAIDVGISTCSDLVPDADRIAELFAQSYAELGELATN